MKVQIANPIKVGFRFGRLERIEQCSAYRFVIEKKKKRNIRKLLPFPLSSQVRTEKGSKTFFPSNTNNEEITKSNVQSKYTHPELLTQRMLGILERAV